MPCYCPCNKKTALISLKNKINTYEKYFFMSWKTTWIKNKYYLLLQCLKYTTSKLFKPHTSVFFQTRGYQNFFQHKIKSTFVRHEAAFNPYMLPPVLLFLFKFVNLSLCIFFCLVVTVFQSQFVIFNGVFVVAFKFVSLCNVAQYNIVFRI